jgi:glycosyltransferase involved in cell wall biosynthesis
MTPSATLDARSLRPLLVANYDIVLGGGEVGLGMLVDGLLARGHRPTLAVPGQRTLFGRCPEEPIPQALPAMVVALRTLARDHDLVHVYSVRAGLGAALARTGRPLLLHLLTPEHDDYDPVVAPFADAILCNSRATGRRFPDGVPRVVHNGVRAPRSTDAGLDTDPNRRTVGVIGNVCPRKGQHDVLPALEQVMALRDDVDVVFAGHATGAIAAELRDRARASLGRIRLLGFVPGIGDLLRELDLVVVPSRSEGFGRVAVESLRAGVPVLATRTGGLPEALADLDDPWLPDDRDAWPERILAELDRPTHTPEELRAAGRRFDPERHLDEVLAVYRELVSCR